MKLKRANCRVSERHSCAISATCKSAASKAPTWPCFATNISQGGICLFAPRRFEPGTHLAIELSSGVVYATVRHLRCDGSDGWYMGCRFMIDLDDHEIDEIVRTTETAVDFDSYQ